MNAPLWIFAIVLLALNVLEIQPAPKGKSGAATKPPVPKEKEEEKSKKTIMKICRQDAIDAKLWKLGLPADGFRASVAAWWYNLTKKTEYTFDGQAMQTAEYTKHELRMHQNYLRMLRSEHSLALRIRDRIIRGLVLETVKLEFYLAVSEMNNEALKKHNDELVSNLVEATRLNGALVTKNKKLTAQRNDLIKACTLLLLYVDYLEREFAKLTVQRNELEKHVASLKEQLTALMHENDLKTQKIYSLQEQITKLNGDLERITAEKIALNEKYTVALNDITNLNKDVTRLTGEKATAETKAEASDKEVKDLSVRLATAETNLKNVNEKVDELKANIAKIEKEAAVSKAQHEAAATSWDKEKQKLTGEKEILQSKLSTAETKSAELSATLEGVNKALAEKETVIAELKRDSANAAEKNKDLEGRLKDIETNLTILRAAKEALSNEHAAQKTKIDGLNVEVAKLEATGKATDQAKVKAEAQNASDAVKLVEYQQRISELQKDQAGLNVKLETLNQQIRDVENARAQSNVSQAKALAEVQNQLNLAIESKANLQRQWESLTRDAAELKTRVAVLETVEQNLNKQNRETLDKNVALEKSTAELGATNQGLNNQLQALNKSLGGFEKELELLHKEFQSQQASQASTQKANTDLTQKNDKLNADISALQSKFSQIKEALNSADAQISQLKLDNAEWGRRCKSWRDNAVKYKNLSVEQKRVNDLQVAQLVAKVGKSSKLLEELKKDNSALRDTLKSETLSYEQKIAALEEFHNKNLVDFGSEVLDATNNSENWEEVPSSWGEVLRSLVPWGKDPKKKMDPKKLRDSIQSIYKRFEEESKPKQAADKAAASGDAYSMFSLVGEDLKDILSSMEMLAGYFVYPASA